MTNTSRHLGPVLPYSANVDAFRLWTAADQSLTVAAWWCAAALAAAVIVLATPDKGVSGIVQLERFAPQIERASALAPDTRDTVNRLLARQRAHAGTASAALEARRQAAIERMSSALDAKQKGLAGR